jgi:hypoxanthine phosphoribosyltransferase
MMTCNSGPHPDIERIVYDEATLHRKCHDLGEAIAKDYAKLQPLLLITVAGAYMFAADLTRSIQPIPDGLQVDFIRASSYGSGTTSSGAVQVKVSCFRGPSQYEQHHMINFTTIRMHVL